MHAKEIAFNALVNGLSAYDILLGQRAHSSHDLLVLLASDQKLQLFDVARRPESPSNLLS